MKPEVKELWLKALRSGKYKQAKYQLRKKDGYCCLGVLCDLYRETTRDGEWRPENDQDYAFFAGLNSEDGPSMKDLALPRHVKLWAGLDSPNPDIGSRSAADYNDGWSEEIEGKTVKHEPETFEQIAKRIEEKL